MPRVRRVADETLDNMKDHVELIQGKMVSPSNYMDNQTNIYMHNVRWSSNPHWINRKHQSDKQTLTNDGLVYHSSSSPISSITTACEAKHKHTH